MNILVWIAIENGRTAFEKDYSVDRSNIFVTEMLFCLIFETFILTKKQICRVTGGSFASKLVSNFLNFNIGYSLIL